MCARESHWHVQNVNSVTTIRLRIKKFILKEWKQKNIVDSVKAYCTQRNKVVSRFFEEVKEWQRERKIKSQEFLNALPVGAVV